MKKFISSILTVILLISAVFSVSFGVSSANPAVFNLKLQKYVDGSYTDNVIVQSGDVLTLFVSVENSVKNVSGLTMQIPFDETRVKYNEKSLICYVADDYADCSAAVKKDNGSQLYIMFDTTSKNTEFNSNIISVTFTVLEGAQEGKAEFSADIIELFDSSSKMEDIPFVSPSDVFATIKKVQIPAETLDAFKKVVTVKYSPNKPEEDSLEDIRAAKTALAALDNSQVALLKAQHPELWDAVNTAQYRYSLQQQDAAVADTYKQVDVFLSTYADVFKMNPNKITLKNKARIEEAYTVYEKQLSKTVKSRIPQEKSKLLKTLVDKIAELEEKAEAMKEAKTEVKQFKNNYKLLFNADETTIKDAYSDLMLMLDEAYLMYDMLSDEAKSLLVKEKKFLDELKVKLEEALAADENAKALADKASEFMNKWKYVFTLTDMSVTAGDESIVNLFIQEYEGLEKELQELLKTRVTRIYGLVEVIQSLKGIAAPDNSGTTTPSNPQGTTQTITQTVTEKVKETVTKTVEKNVNLLIFWLIIILGSLMVVTVIPVSVLVYMNKKNKVITIEGGEEVE